jgi:hypothetical protein
VVQGGCEGGGVYSRQLAQLGHVGNVDDFTITPLEHHSVLLTGVSRRTSSKVLLGGTTYAESGYDHIDGTRTRPEEGRTVDARALVSKRIKPPISENDGRRVSLTQLAQLIVSIGHIEKIDDFTIKSIEQHSYLLSGFSRCTSSLITAEAGRGHVDATHTPPQDGEAVDARAFTSQGSEPMSSDDDEYRLSDCDPKLGSDGGSDGCSSEDELGRSGTRMNVPWDPIDEQRLLAYKKEDKPWKWIFHQFPGRTQPTTRTRLKIVQARGE